MMVGADGVFIGAPSQIPCAKTDSPPERVQGAGLKTGKVMSAPDRKADDSCHRYEGAETEQKK